MNEFIKKISTYDLFVNFIPGCIFVWYLQECKGIELASASDMFTIPTIIVLCYAIGLINNRLGSLVIRPLCERTGIVKFATYETYMKAEKKDDKIKLLSELNNLYRLLTSLSCVLIIMELITDFNEIARFIACNKMLLISVFTLLVFLLSYRSQTRYVVSRVNKVIGGDEDDMTEHNECCYIVKVKVVPKN